MQKKRLVANTTASFLNQIITIVCGFILPRYILKGYGSNINGLVSSINQFLGFISLMDLGVGAVIQSAYYKPLAQKNNMEISMLYKSSKNFFRTIAVILGAYVGILCILYPLITDTGFSYDFIISLILILSISLFAQYYFAIPNQLLLNADQRLYIQSGFQSAIVVGNTILSIILISCNASIQIVKLGSSCIFILRPIILHYYINMNYSIVKNVSIKDYKIEQKWNGLAQHFATVIMNNTDIIILSILAQMSTVSIYTIYNLVTNGLKQFINSISGGFSSFLGDLYARNENETLQKSFDFFEWLINVITVLFFSIAAALIVPFVMIYTRGVTDTDYYQPLFAYTMIFAQSLYCIRIPYNTVICSAGHYKQTQSSAVIETLLNIIISLILVNYWGLIGVATGTVIAIAYRTTSFVKYLRNNILNRKYYKIIKQLSVDILEVVIITAVCNGVLTLFGTLNSYVQLFGVCILCIVVSLIIVFLLNFLVYKDKIIKLKSSMDKRFSAD